MDLEYFKAKYSSDAKIECDFRTLVCGHFKEDGFTSYKNTNNYMVKEEKLKNSMEMMDKDLLWFIGWWNGVDISDGE